MNARCLERVAALGLILLTAGCPGGEEADQGFNLSEASHPVAVLETTQGTIVLDFHPAKAPVHTKNFLSLCAAGFYDGTYFHRVAPGFLIQGGDPNTRDQDLTNDGLGGHTFAGPGTTLRMEVNDSPLIRGSIAMARTEEPDSAGSQFFIMLADSPSLDGQYTVFGEVIEGMEVADRLSEEPGEQVAGVGGFSPRKPQYIENCKVEERSLDGSRM